MKNPFTEHPHSIGETYFQHFNIAFFSGCKLVYAGLACLIHAFFPFLFKTTASTTVTYLYEKLVIKRQEKTTCNENN